MIKELVTDEEILSKPCEKATAEDAEVVEDLFDTMATLDSAACLAANQIGVTKSIFVYLNDDDEHKMMLNPVLKRGLYPYKTSESCLTRDEESKVTRFNKVRVEYDEIVGGELEHHRIDLDGFTAQAVQHMIDHCKGKLV
ncbi:MAG: peptide deformylase [Coriobacteriales bacterium]|jgi:peptide deformylase